MAMFGVSAAAGAIFKVATGTKRAIDFLQSFNGVEEEGYVLWKTLEALTVPVQVAEKLVVREEATGLLLPSLNLIRFQIGKVEEILEIGDDEDDQRPDSKDSWTKWLRSKKDGKDRRERIQEMLPKLNAVLSLLNIGLQTLAVQPELCRRVQPGTDIVFLRAGYAKAKRLLQEFQFGRMSRYCLARGEWWCQGGGSSNATADKTMSNEGRAEVWLCVESGGSAKGKKLQLEVRGLEELDDESKSGEGEDGVLATFPLRFKSPEVFERKRGSELEKAGTLDAENIGDIVYRIAESSSSSMHYFEFLDVVEIGCEVFEAIVVLAKYTDSLEKDFPDEEENSPGNKAEKDKPKSDFASAFSSVMAQHKCAYKTPVAEDELAKRMNQLRI